jgi:nucleoside-diphosphate-sugar epimerase
MIGNGLNKKSIAYVENVASFLVHALCFKPGLHVYNYVDKPDFTMNSLVEIVNKTLNKQPYWNIRIPYILGLLIGFFCDFIGKIYGKKFSISFVRIKKFCSNSVYISKIECTGFSPPIPLDRAIDRTIRYEFIKND